VCLVLEGHDQLPSPHAHWRLGVSAGNAQCKIQNAHTAGLR
jgi:hypothetical protein